MVVGLFGLCLVNAGVLVEGYAGWQGSGKAALVGLGLLVGGFAILGINSASGSRPTLSPLLAPSGGGFAVEGRF